MQPVQRNGRSRSVPVQLTFNCRVTSVLLKRPFRSRSVPVQLTFNCRATSVLYYNFNLLKRPFRSRSRSVQPSMVFTVYTKRRILLYHGQGLCAPTIAKLLEDEGIIVSRRGVAKFILRVKATGSIDRRAGSGRRSKQTAAVKAIVEEAMRADDETTAIQLRANNALRAIFSHGTRHLERSTCYSNGYKNGTVKKQDSTEIHM